MKTIEKSKLRPGDLVWFYSYMIGGFLFGVIVKSEEAVAIWREKSIFSLNDVDTIELIEKIEDVKSYALYDLKDFLNTTKRNNIVCNFLKI